MEQQCYDVAIVGLGPVGAMLAALLGERGHSVIALERSLVVYPEPRAAHVDGEIVRIFQSLGLVPHISPHIRPAPPYEFRTVLGEILMRTPSADIGPDGWFTHYMIYQPGLEIALRQKIAGLPTVKTLLGATVTSFAEEVDTVTVMYTTAGQPHELRAKWVIGCDGGSSVVRKTAGISLDDYGFDEPWLVIDALVADDTLLPDDCIQYCDPARPTTFTLLGPGRYRWEFMLVDGDDHSTITSDESIARLLEPWGGPVNMAIERKAIYHFHGLVATEWRKGRALLIGDAAHQMPPFAGQGLCGGLRDAENLAWKLSAVLRQVAAEQVLDTVQTEREPHVRAITEMAITAGRIVCTTVPAVAAERDRQAADQRARGASVPSFEMPPLGSSALVQAGAGGGTKLPQFVAANRVRSDEVLGPGPWLICADTLPIADPGFTCLRADDVTLEQFGTAFADLLCAQQTPAVLVRPDRVIFGTGAPDALVRDWRNALACRAP